MEREIEVKLLDIDIKDFEEKIKDLYMKWEEVNE